MNSTSPAAAIALALSFSSLSSGAEATKSTAAGATDLAANGAAKLKAAGLTPSQLLGGTKTGPMEAMLGVPNASDLGNYLLTQAMDTSFAYVAKGEAAVRANPGMLKDAVAAKVFGLAKK